MYRQVIAQVMGCLLIGGLLSGCLGGGGGSSSTTETPVASQLDRIVLLVADNNQPADGTAAVTLTAIARDANNQPLSDISISLFSTSDSAIFSEVNGVTSSQGTFIATVTNTIEQTFQVTAQSGATVASEPVNVTFLNPILTDINAQVTDLVLVVNNNFAFANGVDAIELIVVARDINQLPVANADVSLLSSSVNASLREFRGVTGDDGRFVTTVVSNTTETFTVTPLVGTTRGNTMELTFVAPLAAIELTTNNAVLLVGEEANITVRLFRTVSLTEQITQGRLTGDPLPNAPFTAVVSGNAQLIGVPERTDGNGLATFSVTNSSGENVVVTVSSANLNQTLPLYFGGNLALQPLTVNAVGTATLQALLKDANNSPLAGQPIRFGFAGNNNETLSVAEAVTTSNGTAAVTVEDLSQDGGTATVTAQSGQLNASANVNFTAAFGTDRQLSVTTPNTVLNLAQTATITTQITDINGLPIAGQVVTFAAQTLTGEASQVDISPLQATSDASGTVQATVRSNNGENTRITVQADLATQSVDLYFGARLSLLPIDTTGIADGSSNVALTAFLEDFQRQSIAGIPVNFRTDGAALLDSFRLVTDAAGQAIVNVSNSEPQTVTITAQAGLLTPTATARVRFGPSGAANLSLTSNFAELALNSDALLTARVTDSQGNAVRDGTQVNFSVSGPGIVNNTALTSRGEAVATFSATTQAGIATITASSGSGTDSLTLTIRPSDAGIIEVSQVEPAVIGVVGSGVVQSARVEFLVKDNLGNLVADGTPVDFALGQTTLGGGETISSGGMEGRTASATTTDGRVSVTLKSGTVAGTVDIIATVTESTGAVASTIGRVTIVGGLPDANRLSLAMQYLNIAGGVTFGLQNRVTAFIADRYGNIVPDGTAVSFITEGGTIGTSVGGGGFDATTEFGQAIAILQSAAPSTPSLGGVPTLRSSGYLCAGSYAFVSLNPSAPELLCDNPGFTTIVAYTTGNEAFTDSNGNGIYDTDEPFDDMPEPFIDGNINDAFDVGELYIDVNEDGQFTNGNGVYDGPGGVNPNTTVWISAQVLFSARVVSPTITPDSFTLSSGDVQEFIIENISDQYGNPPVAGTTVQVSTNRGTLGGTTEVTLADTTVPFGGIIFTLSSDFQSGISEPQVLGAAIQVTVSSPDIDTAPGSNGTVSTTIPGTIVLLPQEVPSAEDEGN